MFTLLQWLYSTGCVLCPATPGWWSYVFTMSPYTLARAVFTDIPHCSHQSSSAHHHQQTWPLAAHCSLLSSVENGHTQCSHFLPVNVNDTGLHDQHCSLEYQISVPHWIQDDCVYGPAGVLCDHHGQGTYCRMYSSLVSWWETMMIPLQGSDSAGVDNERGSSVSSEVMDCSDHSVNILSGLRRIRQSGLLMDICLWAEGVSFQVPSQTPALVCPLSWPTKAQYSHYCPITPQSSWL